MLHSAVLAMACVCLSVCLSLCPSQSGIVSKRLSVSSWSLAQIFSLAYALHIFIKMNGEKFRHGPSTVTSVVNNRPTTVRHTASCDPSASAKTCSRVMTLISVTVIMRKFISLPQEWCSV